MRTLLEYALANAAAATALALVALVVGRVVRRPAARHALWVLVLVRLVLPPVWTVPLPTLGADAPPAGIVSTLVDPIIPGPWGDEDWPAPPAPSVDEGTAGPAAAPVAEEAAVPFPVNSVLVSVWAAGCLFVFARSAWRVGRFRRALHDARPAPAEFQAQAAALATAIGLRRCPMVLVVPGRVWPALWMPGLLPRQAKILLPAGLMSLLDPGQRAAVLAHELAHLRRGDPWVRWLEVVVCGLYWWFPLVVWFRRHLRASEEACCDLWVVGALGGRRSYATALVETAAFLGGPDPVASPVLASGAGPVLDLQRRVTMIMQATWPARLTRLGLATVLGVGAAGLSFGPALAQPPERERPKDGDRKKDADPPRGGDRERPKDGDRERPKDGDRRPDAPREKGTEAEIQKAREAAEKARKDVREAMQRMQEAEERLAKAEGRPARPVGGGGFGVGVGGFGPGGGGFGGAGGPGPMGPGGGGFGGVGGFGGPGGGGGGAGGGGRMIPKDGDRRPDPERRPDGDRRPDTRPAPEVRGGGGDVRDLQKQIEELRQALEEMRREMRRGTERRGGGEGPKGGGNRE